MIHGDNIAVVEGDDAVVRLNLGVKLPIVTAWLGMPTTY